MRLSYVAYLNNDYLRKVSPYIDIHSSPEFMFPACVEIILFYSLAYIMASSQCFLPLLLLL